MSETEKLEILKQMYISDGSDGSEPTGDDTLLSYLRLAGTDIINHVYPFKHDIREVPAKYAMVQIELAVYYLNKRGAEGEAIHNENGTYRTYESGSIPESIKKKLTPFVKFL